MADEILRVRYLDESLRQRLARPTIDEVEAIDWQQHIEYTLGYPCWIAREPEWTDAEHNEIMRLHISEGLTISGAKWRVYQQRGDQHEQR